MSSLRELQERFKAAILGDGATGDMEDQILAKGVPAARRLNVYRNNVRSNLTGSLRATYPAIEAIVGARFFGMIAESYLTRHPPTSGNIHDFGARFDSFLQEAEQAQNHALTYLPDVARLEWAYHRVFHEAEETAVSPDILSTVDPERYGEIQLALHPASRLVASAFPVTSIWKLAIHGSANSKPIRLDQGGENVLVARRNLEIEFQYLTAAEFAFLNAIDFGKNLEGCARDALDIDSEFDLGACLARHFRHGNFTGIRLADRPVTLGPMHGTSEGAAPVRKPAQIGTTPRTTT